MLCDPTFKSQIKHTFRPVLAHRLPVCDLGCIGMQVISVLGGFLTGLCRANTAQRNKADWTAVVSPQRTDLSFYLFHFLFFPETGFHSWLPKRERWLCEVCGESTGLRIRWTWAGILTLPLTCCVTLCKSLNLL